MRIFDIIAFAGGAAALVYTLSEFGRRATFGELAGVFGDADACAAANSISFTQALEAGARKLLGGHAVPQETYVVHTAVN